MRLLFWVGFICLLENFIRKTCVGEVSDCGWDKHVVECYNSTSITQMFGNTWVTDPAYSGKVGSYRHSGVNA